MQLAEWMKENRWTMSEISKKTGICRLTIKKAMTKKGEIYLRSAMEIYKFTNGEVSFEEMLREVKE